VSQASYMPARKWYDAKWFDDSFNCREVEHNRNLSEYFTLLQLLMKAKSI